MKWYVDIYVNGVLMAVNYFRTKMEALDFIEENGVKCYEMGTEVVVK